MKTLFYTTIFLSVVLLSGCFAPVTQTYDSARMVKKNKMEVKANYSFYDDVAYEGNYDGEDIVKNTNFGIAVVYGLEDKTNLGFRYEYINNQTTEIEGDINSQWLGDLIDSYRYSDIHFFEFNSKFSLKEGRIAFSAPVGLYNFADVGGTIFEFKPRFHFTFPNKKNTFEFSIVPQGKFFLSGGTIVPLIPSLSFGMGFSSDLDKWAIRPEISYDYYTTAVGISVSYLFPLRQEE